MVNVIVASIERKGRISVANAQAEYTRLMVGIIRTRYKAAVDAKLIQKGHIDYIPEGERPTNE